MCQLPFSIPEYVSRERLLINAYRLNYFKREGRRSRYDRCLLVRKGTPSDSESHCGDRGERQLTFQRNCHESRTVYAGVGSCHTIIAILHSCVSSSEPRPSRQPFPACFPMKTRTSYASRPIHLCLHLFYPFINYLLGIAMVLVHSPVLPFFHFLPWIFTIFFRSLLRTFSSRIYLYIYMRVHKDVEMKRSRHMQIYICNLSLCSSDSIVSLPPCDSALTTHGSLPAHIEFAHDVQQVRYYPTGKSSLSSLNKLQCLRTTHSEVSCVQVAGPSRMLRLNLARL